MEPTEVLEVWREWRDKVLTPQVETAIREGRSVDFSSRTHTVSVRGAKVPTGAVSFAVRVPRTKAQALALRRLKEAEANG